MRQNHLLKILSICTLISSFASASEIVLPLSSGEHSGKDPNLFTMLTTSSQGTHYMLKGSVVFSDFQGEAIQKSGGAFCNLKGPLRFSGTTPIASILLKNLHVGGMGAGIYSLSPILFENMKSFQVENNISFGGAIAAQNIVFDKNHQLVFKNNTSRNSGGAILLNGPQTNSLVIKNQRRSVVFSNNQATSSNIDYLNRGGAIACLTPDSLISFERNQEILFQNNSSQMGGAIYTQGPVAFAETQESLSFIENSSQQHGGAVRSSSFHLYNQFSPISFYANRAELCGGAIYADKVNICGNTGAIEFQNNTSGSFGGAIYANSCLFQNQYAPISFLNNKAKDNGGAIYAEEIEITDNYSPVIFKNNSSEDCGGAFATNHCRIVACNDVIFENNIATGPSGGAIFLNGNQPSLHLEACCGNIIFRNNAVSFGFSPGSSGEGVIDQDPDANRQPYGIPNSITIGTNPSEVLLAAQAPYSIYFFDPIHSNKNNSTPIHINKSTAQGPAEGCVVFSRSDTRSPFGNWTSALHHPVHLHNGILAIDQGASLLVKEFKQSGGSLVVYPNSGLYVCSGTTHFSNISFGLGHDSARPNYAQIDAPNIILSGSPTIHDPQGKFYYDHDVAAHPFHMDIMFHSRQNNNVNTDQFVIEDVVIENPSYGYQGSWKFQWLSPQSNTLRAIWTPTGEYFLNPKQCGQLVPSSMWSTALAIRMANDTIMDNFLNDSTLIPVDHTCVFAGGLSGINKPDFSSNLCNDQDSPMLQTEHLGEFVGIKVPFSPDTVVSGTFVQMHGSCSTRSCIEDEDSSRSKIILGNVAAFKNWDALSFRASLNYAEETHDIQYAIQNKDLTKGCWKNQGWCGSVGLSYAYPRGIRYLKITPFADLEYIAIKQNPFLEIGADPRYFSSSYLVNVSLPTGVMLELRLFGSSYSLLMKCGMAYVKDIKRENPSTSASLVLNEYQWKVPSLPMGEEAIQFKCHTTLKYKAITTYLGFATSQKEGNHMSAHASGGVSVSF